MSVLIWVQTVCKCYQQTTKVVASKVRVFPDFFLAKEATKQKIERIIQKQFGQEIENKEAEIMTISEVMSIQGSFCLSLRHLFFRI